MRAKRTDKPRGSTEGRDGKLVLKTRKKQKTTSLRTLLFMLMAMLVALQTIALALSLVFSDVFTALDAEGFRVFDSTAQSRAQVLNKSMAALGENLQTEASLLSGEISEMALETNTAPQELFLNNKLYRQEALLSGRSLLRVLRNNSVTGAFVILNGSNVNKTIEGVHSAVFIRNTTPGAATGDDSNYILELGPNDLVVENQIGRSETHRFDLIFGADNADVQRSYSRPMQAAADYPNLQLERFGYWSTPIDMLGNGQQGVCYTLPLLDSEGVAFGVIGLEITLEHLARIYLPNEDFPYEDSFYAIAPVQDNRIDLAWFIASGPQARGYLEQSDSLQLSDVPLEHVKKTQLQNRGEVYCAPHELEIYGADSPFAKDEWTLVAFVSKDVLHSISGRMRRNLYTSMVVTMAVSLVAVALFSILPTRRIVGLSKYVKGLRPDEEISFRPTGFAEIDDLTNAVETLNRSVVNASRITSKIIEMTSMPMGYFEIRWDVDYVVTTDYVYELLHRSKSERMTRAQWDEIYARLMAEPESEFENVYRYENTNSGAVHWLRILQADTQNGYVGTIHDISEDIERTKRLAYELDHDALTLLYNRNAFKRMTHRMIASRPSTIGAMLFVDLDNLKYINDTYGHDMGDQLLIKAGKLFSHFEEIGGVVSRISGDEFAIYLHGFETKQQVLAQVDKIHNNNNEVLIPPDGSVQRVRFSAGLAWYPADSNNVTDLLKLSDYAMYEAKRNSKGTLYEFDRESYTENAYLLENREAINRLLDDKLIQFAFQPIVSLTSGKVVAYEALMRPLLDNFQTPQEILGVASNQFRLKQLERLVMRTAFDYVSEHLKEIGERKIFINSIPSQHWGPEDADFLSEKYADAFGKIVIEITEGVQSSVHTLSNKAKLLREMKLPIAIDDFGAGYSNEMRILSLNPDVIKIDMGIIQGIHMNPDKQKLVANIVAYCKPRGILTIAEGVEQREDLIEVIQQDIDLVQGFYTGRPEFCLKETEPETAAFIRSFQ